MKIELIYDPDCPHVESTRENLRRALQREGHSHDWQEWNQQDAGSPGYVHGYGSPTVLINDQDVADQPNYGVVSCCRLYENAEGTFQGSPSVEAIQLALQNHAGTGKPTSRHNPPSGGWLSLGVLPGIGIGFLPVLGCPACWPAYAAIAGSLGVGFIVQVPYLLAITVMFMAGAVFFLGYNAQKRQGYGPFLLGLIAAATVLVGKFALGSAWLNYIGLALLGSAAIWNAWPHRQGTDKNQCPNCPSNPKQNRLLERKVL